MRSIGVRQLQEKRHAYIGLTGDWCDVFGNLPTAFVGIVWGKSGHGKTEFLMRFAKELCKYGRVGWLSYEQGDGPDLAEATRRNKMEEVQTAFKILVPQIKSDTSKVEEFLQFVESKRCPDYLFVDSLDYLQMRLDEYFLLKERVGKRRGLVFISHERNNLPESKVGQKILYDGMFGFGVRHFIARASKGKNRMGTPSDYIIWEEKARERDKLYFKDLEAEE